MRKVLLGLLTLTLLLGFSTSARAESEPTVVVQLKSIDGLISDVKFIATQAGKADEAEQLEQLLKAFTGEKGLEGIDTKKPMGAYVKLGPNVVDSEAVVLVPVKDSKKFLVLIGMIPGVNPEKGKDDVYTVEMDNLPVPIFFRFANDYVYVTGRDKDVLDLKSIPKPASVFAKESATGSITFNVDSLPAEMKEMAKGQVARMIADLKDKGNENEPAPIKKLRLALLDEAAKFFTTFVDGAGKLGMSFDVNQKEKDLSFAFQLSGQKNSDLAAMISDVGKGKSATGGILSEKFAGQGVIHVALPTQLKKPYLAAFEELKKMAMAQAKGIDNPLAKKHLPKLIEAIAPSLKRGELDQALSFTGPGKDGTYTFVAATGLVGGKNVEATIKGAWSDIPADFKEQIENFIKLDDFKVGGVNVHKLDVGPFMPEDAQVVFGNNPIYFAFRDDAMILGMGEEGKKAITSAVKSEAVTAEPFRMEISMAQLATLMDQEQPGTSKIAKRVFKDSTEDRIRVTLKGGKSLELRFGMDAKLIKFFTELDAANN